MSAIAFFAAILLAALFLQRQCAPKPGEKQADVQLREEVSIS